MTTFETTKTSAFELDSDALVVGVLKDRMLGKLASQADKALQGGLADALARVNFDGETGEVSVIPTFGKIAPPAIVVVGLGVGKATNEEVRRGAAEAAKKTKNFKRVALDLGDGVPGGTQAAVEGFILGSYSFNHYKSKADKPGTETVFLTGNSDRAAIERGETIANAVIWARDLVNRPAGERGPAEFARAAAQRAEEVGVEVEIHDEKMLKKLGMNGILSVGQGSTSPPRLLVMSYKPRGAKSLVGAVGKGITFDSGGLSIKTAEGMESMKADCSGAAAVVAAITAAAKLKTKTKIVAAVPLAENMPSGNAIRPGDVIRHYGGRTSEVLNTDAEGRLVLADAMAWISEKKPDAIVDLATLTGGMVVALGKKTAGFFTNDRRLAREIISASARTGEPIWEMPLIDDLRKEIDSPIADIKNTGGRWGSPIFGALFLRDFIGHVPWAHIDIAGPAFADRAEHYISRGATGMGTRLLINWFESRAS